MLPSLHHDLEPQKTKGKGLMIFLLIIILVAAASTAVYYWQKMEAKKLATTTEEKVRNEMQGKINETENKLTELQKQLTEESDINNYSTWKTYINNNYGYSFRYPATYNISEQNDGETTTLSDDNQGIISFLPTGKKTFDLPTEDPNVEKIDINGLQVTRNSYANFFIITLDPGVKNWSQENKIIVTPETSPEIANKVLNTFKILQIGENIFDPNLLKIGDKIGDMTVKEIGPMNISDPIDVTNNYKVSFTGKVNVSGKLFFSELGNTYCFDVNPTDWIKIPKLKNDDRYPWFCLNKTNASTIDNIISTNEGMANITINNYILSEYPTSGSDLADLIKINN